MNSSYLIFSDAKLELVI